ncbi:MAG: DUF72 domain-containing protein [Planctomycetes bacterium]|nr:DUF72 domain-containing protein [Planctomycetota bacterium]
MSNLALGWNPHDRNPVPRNVRLLAYDAWCGSFYPEGTKSEAFLAHYAAHLPAVEINQTFHQYPRENVLATWVHRPLPRFASR